MISQTQLIFRSDLLHYSHDYDVFHMTLSLNGAMMCLVDQATYVITINVWFWCLKKYHVINFVACINRPMSCPFPWASISRCKSKLLLCVTKKKQQHNMLPGAVKLTVNLGLHNYYSDSCGVIIIIIVPGTLCNIILLRYTERLSRFDWN